MLIVFDDASALWLSSFSHWHHYMHACCSKIASEIKILKGF